MDCQELDRLLEEHPLAALSPEQRQAVAAHVADCERCRQMWGLDQHSQVLHDAAKPLSSESSVRAGVMAGWTDCTEGVFYLRFEHSIHRGKYAARGIEGRIE